MYLLTLEKLKKASEKIPESEIIVVTQYEEIVKKAGEMKIPVFINPRPEDGISLSMQIGLMSVRDTDACLFTVSDQPWLEADTVVALTELFENEKKGMACIRWNGKTGNPCIFEADGILYQSMEQYMMAQKAAYFGDYRTHARILSACTPGGLQSLGTHGIRLSGGELAPGP